MKSEPLHAFFASTSPGLEFLLEQELATLGFKPRRELGGAFWKGRWRDLYRAALSLRTASHVLVRIKGGTATSFPELELLLGNLPWELWLQRHASFRVDAACRASALYHEGAVVERVSDWITRRTQTEPAPLGSEPSQRFMVRIVHDTVELSVDAAGPLHRRGYRLATAKAPLRENLAAALLYASGWVPAVTEGLGRGAAVRYKTPTTTLDDPFCGSGTIPIEAALLARRIPPGLATADRQPRPLACQDWQDFDAEAWEKTVTSLQSHILSESPVVITGGDRDDGAIQAARANAERAGVNLAWERRAVLQAAWTPGSFVVTNPPYGHRISEHSDLRNLFAAFGKKISQDGVSATWLDGTEHGEGLAGLHPQELLRTKNGGLPIRFLRFTPSQA